MSKTKHNPPKPKTTFIKFSEVQQSYLNEVRIRQMKEFNMAVEKVYTEVGILEKATKAPPGTYKLKMDDLSGVNIFSGKS